MSQVDTQGDAKPWRFYHLRNWLGMPLSVWLSLLVRNRFAVTRLGQAARMSVFACGNSLFHRLDQLCYAGRVRRGPPSPPPLFVVGHWRTGTTLLHELLVLDEQFSYPTTYQVMAPHHFLLTRYFIPKLFNHAVPSRRPMDVMEMGFDKPQEDEFALCNLGLPSPYLRMAFPKHYTQPGLYLDVEELSAAERERWRDGFTTFLRRVAWLDPRRVVLKSPTHTARLRTLATMFPGAQFVHIVRDPYEVFASTVHTWRRLWDVMGYHAPPENGYEEYVLATLDRMYKGFEAARATLGEKQFCEVRFEDLTQNPLGELQRIYEQLGLAGFDRARPKIEAYFAAKSAHKKNRHALAEPLKREVAERWRGYFERYGYEA